MAEGFHTVQDEEILGAVLRLAEKSEETPKVDNGLDPAFRHLAEQIVRYATGEDSNWEEPHKLLTRAVNAWKVGAKRKGAQSIVALKVGPTVDDGGDRLILNIVTDDKPFLVDSIIGALSDAGKPVSFFVNAILDVHREDTGARTSDANAGAPVRESIIYAEMDPPVGPSEIGSLGGDIEKVLEDVARAVADWEPMRARLASCIAQLERARPQIGEREELREAVDFLKWLWDNRFAFLGARRFHYNDKGETPSFVKDEEADLGILKDGETRILKSTYTDDGAPSASVIDFMSSGEPVIIAKANARSNVHRRVHMDYIGVKMYGVDGRVIGEERFVGLFASDAYNRPASDIPLARAKVRKVIESSGFVPGGHNEKALLNILETFPRDEIFQSDLQSLRENALGILRLYKRPRTKLFLRRDRFDRFVSALVFVPRDRFSSQVRERIGDLLAETFEGYVAAFNPYFGDAALVRVHFIIGIAPGAPQGPGLTELTRGVRDIVRSWGDGLIDELRNAPLGDGVSASHLFSRYEEAFDAAYTLRTPPAAAIADILALEAMGDKAIDARVYRPSVGGKSALGLKLYCRDRPQRLSDLIPRLENLGLNVVQEAGYDVRLEGGERFWIHDFYTEENRGRDLALDDIGRLVEDALLSVLAGVCEDDGFNALVTTAGLSWREASILRASAKYALQTRFPFSQSYIEETLSTYPAIAKTLVRVFHARFNPAGATDMEERAREVEEAEAEARDQLEGVNSLDQDQIIRQFLSFFQATVRTNSYQRTDDGDLKPVIAFKIDSCKLPEIPEPKPYREIFVSGPRVDGVHLRFGPVSRGGLRWSDRREDFRTEVLGLVKAQRVKNAVIVPTGSKGGFYPKRLPQNGDRNEIFEEGRGAYQEFIRGLLDLTDNIVSGKPVTPDKIVRWDDTDTYLVVAADKGTATFSDTANAISKDYGFWLGDAFASGGSAGYDHKVMGITARGAWEAVKRHFREMDKDIQSEPFTVAGVGDMSGDVFGNGMLLSEQIRLVAAFDHRDIFLDPDPDPAASWKERKRVFEMGRSSWNDYEASLISKGGGVFSRSAKSIPLSEEARKLLGVDNEKPTPNEVIRAILKLNVELFWLGGIGTYFKADAEENWRVGDRANDAVRINASDMAMKVIGEGANLGLTQDARIAFARAGGRINTDAIDNSAGVDSSDHEVNIKILVSGAIEQGELKSDDRDALLKEMTDDVARHVLRHNYEQTRGVSLAVANAAHDLDAHARLMQSLEAQGRLDRALENLPDDKAIAGLRNNGEGLTRPELSVLVAYAKMQLFDALCDSTAPDDRALENELFAYFPDQLHDYNVALVKHRLRREIIATRLSNDIVDSCGPAFAHEVCEATGADYADLAIAYEAARRILNLGAVAARIDALDTLAPAATQNDLYAVATHLLGEQVYKILIDAYACALMESKGVKGLTDRYAVPMEELRASLPSLLSGGATRALKRREAAWKKAGAPEEIAAEAALMPSLEHAFDIVNLAQKTGWKAPHVAAIFFEVGDMFAIDAAREAARTYQASDRFGELALRRQVEDLAGVQAALASSVMAHAKKPPTDEPSAWLKPLMADWRKTYGAPARQTMAFVDDLDLAGGVSIAKLSLATAKLDDLVKRTRV